MSRGSAERYRPVSPEAQAYLDVLLAEIDEMTEHAAQEWIKRRAENPEAKIWPKK